jgi:putative membrane protein
MWDYGGHMGWMWLWWIVGLALLVAVIWAVARAATPQRPADHESPEAILKRRYARGEVDREEYERRLKDLRM